MQVTQVPIGYEGTGRVQLELCKVVGDEGTQEREGAKLELAWSLGQRRDRCSLSSE